MFIFLVFLDVHVFLVLLEMSNETNMHAGCRSDISLAANEVSLSLLGILLIVEGQQSARKTGESARR